MARVGGIEYHSTNVTVMSQFPSYTQIEGDVDVRPVRHIIPVQKGEVHHDLAMPFEFDYYR